MFCSSQQTKLVCSSLLFATILYLTTLRTINVYHTPVAKETICFGLCDFHNAVYFPGLAFARGENPYSSAYAAKYPVNREMSPYSPMLLPFVALMGVLPLRMSEYVWFSTNIFLMFVLSLALLYLARARINAHRVLILASLLLFSRAGQSNQILGQFGTLFCLFSLVAIRCAQTNKKLSAMGLALATIKPTFGIPLILMMLVGKKVQPVVLGVLFASVGTGLSLSWIVVNEPTNLLASFAGSHDAIVADENVEAESAWMRTDLVSVIARSFSVTSDSKNELLGMLLILVPAFVSLWKLSNSLKTEETRSLEQAIVLTIIPLCIYHLSYDLLVVLPAMALALSGRLFTTQKQATLFRITFVALLLIPLMNYFAAYSVMERLQILGLLRELAIVSNPVALLVANVVLWIAVYNHRAIEVKQQWRETHDLNQPTLVKISTREKSRIPAPT